MNQFIILEGGTEVFAEPNLNSPSSLTLGGRSVAKFDGYSANLDFLDVFLLRDVSGEDLISKARYAYVSWLKKNPPTVYPSLEAALEAARSSE